MAYFYYGSKNLETDRVKCNSGGVIIEWSLWSECCQDWIPVSIPYILENWPSRFEEMLNFIEQEKAG